MNHILRRVFVTHPQSVDETYFEHMRFAGWFAYRLLMAACAAIAHAIIPCLFEKTAGRIVGELNARLSSRH